MLRKLVIFAITSGLAAKAYRAYAAKREAKTAQAAPSPNGVRRAI